LSAGYVERRACEEDGRGQLMFITDAGKAIRRKMRPVHARAIEAAIGNIFPPRKPEL
jgi:DNA-binding MarR family transcriptional regulator